MASLAFLVICLAITVSAANTSSSSRLHHHRRLDQLLDFFNIHNLQETLQRGQDDSAPSQMCRAETETFLKALSDGEPWADKMFDATGRYSSQFLFGNDFFLGSQSLCNELGRNTSILTLGEDKEDASFLRWRAYPPPYEVNFHVVKLRVKLPLQRFRENVREISWGLCLPGGCSPEDSEELARLMAEKEAEAGAAPMAAAVKVISSRKVPGGYSMWKDTTFRALAVSSSVVILMTAIGTLLDLKRAGKSGDKKGVSLRKGEKCVGGDVRRGPEFAALERRSSIETTLPGVLMCFSLARNARKILNGGKDQRSNRGCASARGSSLSCLHGLRFLSLAWIILGHTCHVSFLYSDNKHYRAIVERDFLFQTVGNGPYAVDTFFFISGLLLSFLYFRSITVRDDITTIIPTTPETSVHPAESITKRIKRFVTLVAYRMVRLTPPYLFVIGVVEVMIKRFRSESVFDPPADDDINCPNYWWRNALYINTLFPVKEMCMIWSWYLSDDTQFYVIGLVILLVASSHFKVAAIFAGMVLLCSWLSTGFIALEYDYVPRISEPLALFDQLYDKPWTRVGPHIIGLATGWILHRTNCKMNIRKGTVVIGWILSMCVCLILIYGLHGKTIGPMSSAVYAALSRSAWAVSLVWIVTACAAGKGGWINGFLSWKALEPLSRLTYCAYLVHPIIVRASVAHLDSPMHISRDSFAFLFVGHVLASYFLAFIVSVALESPIISLLKMAISIRRHH